jgi:hypothetical protein
VVIDFKVKGEEVMVIVRKQVIKGRKKKKMPQVEFDMEGIREIKRRKKRCGRKREEVS